MLDLVLLVFFGVATVAAMAVPFLLPWPQQLRWMVISTAVPDLTRVGGWPSPISLREVVLRDVDTHATGVVIRLIAPDAPAEPLLRWIPATAADMNQLHIWAADGGPLLLITAPGGAQSLHRDVGAVEGLRTMDFGVAFDESLATVR